MGTVPRPQVPAMGGKPGRSPRADPPRCSLPRHQEKCQRGGAARRPEPPSTRAGLPPAVPDPAAGGAAASDPGAREGRPGRADRRPALGAAPCQPRAARSPSCRGTECRAGARAHLEQDRGSRCLRSGHLRAWRSGRSSLQRGRTLLQRRKVQLKPSDAEVGCTGPSLRSIPSPGPRHPAVPSPPVCHPLLASLPSPPRSGMMRPSVSTISCGPDTRNLWSPHASNPQPPTGPPGSPRQRTVQLDTPEGTPLCSESVLPPCPSLIMSKIRYLQFSNPASYCPPNYLDPHPPFHFALETS